ncbi:MAG: hypothetical protein JSW08_02930 [archaeon]|nr:MAG: hypothetical protein JSW08_02930 [archaeon]
MVGTRNTRTFEGAQYAPFREAVIGEGFEIHAGTTATTESIRTPGGMRAGMIYLRKDQQGSGLNNFEVEVFDHDQGPDSKSVYASLQSARDRVPIKAPETEKKD